MDRSYLILRPKELSSLSYASWLVFHCLTKALIHKLKLLMMLGSRWFTEITQLTWLSLKLPCNSISNSIMLNETQFSRCSWIKYQMRAAVTIQMPSLMIKGIMLLIWEMKTCIITLRVMMENYKDLLLQIYEMIITSMLFYLLLEQSLYLLFSQLLQFFFLQMLKHLY